MFKISDVAPDIAAKLEAYEREMAEHRAQCKAEFCEQCGRRPKADLVAMDRAFAELGKRRAFDTVPAAFHDVELSGEWLAKLVGSEAMHQAQTSIDARRATFLGPPGAGKTSLAVAMFRRAIEVGKDAAWFRYVSSHALAKARATSQLGDEAPLVEACLRSPLLLVDELGGEDSRHASAVAEVIYERHAENRRTWVTTGATPKAIADRYGGGIARRVFEGATIFRLGGKR